MAKRAAKRRVTRKTRGRKVRLALIGAGSMANGQHYPSLAENKDADMAALCDLVPEKLEATADKFGIKRRYTDYRKMLDEVKPDAVYCLMPPHHLFDISADVLLRGLHLFVEKPLALNAFQANSLARLAAENKCLTMVGFNRRFAPLAVMAKKAVEKYGGPQLCRAVFHKNSKSYYYHGAIDSISCDAIHVVDLLRWMGGDVADLETAVSIFRKKKDPDPVPNSWISVVRFEDGGVGELSANWASGTRWLYCEMHAPGISTICEIEKTLVIKEGDPVGKTYRAEEVAGSTEARICGGYKQENDHFIECIKKGKQPLTHFADAAKTMELAEAIMLGGL